MSLSLDAANPPACPAGSEVVASFVHDRWNYHLDRNRWATVLDRRESHIRDLRAAGDPRAADAIGWLTLAAIVSGLPATLVNVLLRTPDPARLADAVASVSGDGRPAFYDRTEVSPGRYRTAAGFDVVDASSRAGWAVADLAGRAATGEVVVVGSMPTTPASFRNLLRSRLDSAVAR